MDSDRRRTLLVTLVAFVGAMVWFGMVAVRTPGDVDEGFYATAAELVARGRLVYRDFFYPQAPLLPYVLAPAHWIGTGGYVAFRLWCALFGAGTAALVAYAVHRETRSVPGAFAAVALFAGHELSWQWVGSIRAYAPAGFFGVLAMVLVTDPRRAPTWWQGVLAGMCAMAVPGVRLMLVPVVAGVIVTAALRASTVPALRGALLVVLAARAGGASPADKKELAVIALLGAAVLLADTRAWRVVRTCVPVLIGVGILGAFYWLAFYHPAPEAFRFGNIGYHEWRADGGLVSTFEQAQNATMAIGGAGQFGDRSAAGSQFVLLGALALAALVMPGSERRFGAIVVCTLIFYADLKPNPIHEHYFTPIVPYLALLAGVALGGLTRATQPVSRTAPWALPAGVVMVFAVAGHWSFERKVIDGWFGPWNMAICRPQRQDRALALVQQAVHTHPGPLLAAWEGSALGVADRILPGFENHFARNVAWHQSTVERRRLHTATHEEFAGAIENRVPSVLVLDREVPDSPREMLTASALAHGYTRFGTRIDETEVFVRIEPAPAGRAP